ncbi:MAG: heavy-metal-associated domain-containing protein [Bacteroidales bacterium]|nr:heavy-metal-associated domain-containing protein [Bacteroidales bacterium]MCD8393297.1 heavy-metal-associated domain-containing protein [Bacteroidales bacterium]
MRKIALALSLLVAVAAWAAKPVTVVFTVEPAMSCQNCEKKITENLRYVKGVSDIVTTLKDNTVTVTYDQDKSSVANLQAEFKKIGYTATEVTGKASKVAAEKPAKAAKVSAKKAACCKE